VHFVPKMINIGGGLKLYLGSGFFDNDNEREFIQRVVTHKQISHALNTMVPTLLCEQNCL